jgi:hypothetical protein
VPPCAGSTTAPPAASPQQPTLNPIKQSPPGALPKVPPFAPAPSEERLALSAEPGISAQATVGYSLLGLSAVGLGAGLFFGLSSRADTRTVEERCLSSGLCPASADTPLADSQSNALASDVGVGVGIAALAAGLYLLLDEPSAPAIGTTLTSSGGGISLKGAF